MKKIRELCLVQKALNNFIQTKHGLEENHKLYDDIKLALLTEIGELANETRCFKFWSQKEMSPKEVLLEEAADILHHSLSILNFGANENAIHGLTLSELYEQSEKTRVFVNELQVDIFSDNLTGVFLEMYSSALIGQAGMVIMDLCYAMKMLGCTAEELEEAYFAKNNKNYERQNNGY